MYMCMVLFHICVYMCVFFINSTYMCSMYVRVCIQSLLVFKRILSVYVEDLATLDPICMYVCTCTYTCMYVCMCV